MFLYLLPQNVYIQKISDEKIILKSFVFLYNLSHFLFEVNLVQTQTHDQILTDMFWHDTLKRSAFVS